MSQTVFGADVSEWAKGDYLAANEKGLIPISMALNSPKDNVTRSEFCALVMNMYDTMSTDEVRLLYCPFTDCMDSSVARAYSLGIVSGKSETEFCPLDPITRQEMAKILVGALEAAGMQLNAVNGITEKIYYYSDFSDISEWALPDFAKAVGCGLMSGVSEAELKPQEYATREQAVVIVNRSESKFMPGAEVYQKPTILNMTNGEALSGDMSVAWNTPEPGKEYILIVKDEDGGCVDFNTSPGNSADIYTEGFDAGKRYSVTVAETDDFSKTVYSDPVEFVYGNEETNLALPTSWEDKYQRIFPSGEPFASKEEADANIVTVEVPVWHLSGDGAKVPSKAKLLVNKNLADDVVSIFTEIYEDPEQFPIKSVGGYSWRNTAGGRLSEHSYGTCIDINSNENYYCHAETGTAITGSFWLPYENPYSIPADGSVVRIFAKYGWAWGGNAWTRLRDYMHFTYLGN